jgi:hypothetical protein
VRAFESHLVWEPVAAAGDPFALPAQEQGGTNKGGSCDENFSLLLVTRARGFAKKMLLQEEPKDRGTNNHTSGTNGRTSVKRQDHTVIFEGKKIILLSTLKATCNQSKK